MIDDGTSCPRPGASLSAFSSKCLQHVFPVLSKHQLCLAVDFCQYELRMRGLVSILFIITHSFLN